MKIACIDKTAHHRFQLQRRLEAAIEANRNTIGHIPVGSLTPLSRDELLLGRAPDLVIIGPALSPDEVFLLTRDIQRTFDSTDILCILAKDNFTLAILGKLENAKAELVEENDSLTLVVRAIVRKQNLKAQTKHGKLSLFSGVKGGVGTTSLVSSLAHAAQALGQSTVIIDLSRYASLLHYSATPRWQSADYSLCLEECRSPSLEQLDSFLTVAPNGLHFLLPPAGTDATRMLWLHNQDRAAVTLSIVELLTDQFDHVFVDAGTVDCHLRLLLAARAARHIFITSTDAASTHLLSKVLLEQPYTETPRIVYLNAIQPQGLIAGDVLLFLKRLTEVDTSQFQICEIPYEPSIRFWMGSGNTPFTEGRRRFQRRMEQLIRAFDQTTPVESVRMFGFQRFRLPKFPSLGTVQRESELSPAMLPATPSHKHSSGFSRVRFNQNTTRPQNKMPHLSFRFPHAESQTPKTSFPVERGEVQL